MNKHEIPSDKLLFGQFLIKKKKLNQETLEKALLIQEKETDNNIVRDSHRLLGQILLEEFGLFKNRLELNNYIIEFKAFKEQLESIRAEIRGLEHYGKKKKHI